MIPLRGNPSRIFKVGISSNYSIKYYLKDWQQWIIHVVMGFFQYFITALRNSCIVSEEPIGTLNSLINIRTIPIIVA